VPQTSEERVHEQGLASFNNNAALFTAVADNPAGNGDDFLKVISLRAAGLKTFWTVTRSQLIGIDGQMAMSAPQPGALFRQEHELAMIAGRHVASHPQGML
jgi:hypothetical protein